MGKLGVDECVVFVFLLVVMSMYVRARTVVRIVHGNSDNFEVKVGVHQGLALYCGKNKCLWKQIELVFGIKVSTEDSCFVLDEGLDLLTEKGDLPGAGVLDLENFQLLLCHGHCPNNC